jgi:hypothetical protein
MGFTVGSLTAYVNEQSQDLLTALHFEGETAAIAAPHAGIKSSEAIQLLANTPIAQDGSTCAFNASGDTAFTQAILAVSTLKWQDTLCIRALEAKWTQLMLRAGTVYTEADIPKMVISDVTELINQQLETADWAGDTTSWSQNLKQYDGLQKLIKAASGTNVATAVAGPVTTSNVRTIVQNIIAKIPAQLKGNPKFKIFMGYDIASLYQQKIFVDNLYHAPASKDQKGMYAEGTNHEIVPLHGLDGFGANSGDNPFIFGCIPERNLHYGFDMLNEEEKAEMGMDQYNENVWYTFRLKRGWQIVYPAEIVEYSNT